MYMRTWLLLAFVARADAAALFGGDRRRAREREEAVGRGLLGAGTGVAGAARHRRVERRAERRRDVLLLEHGDAD